LHWKHFNPSLKLQNKTDFQLNFIIDIIGYPDYAFNDTGVDLQAISFKLTLKRNDSYFQLISKLLKSNDDPIFLICWNLWIEQMFTRTPAVVRRKIPFVTVFLEVQFKLAARVRYHNFDYVSHAVKWKFNVSSAHERTITIWLFRPCWVGYKWNLRSTQERTITIRSIPSCHVLICKTKFSFKIIRESQRMKLY